ncbi:protein FAM32A-like [Pistacia vera]|uniref:protein FAM32A-like n=1 Tax=Pistacia vera TaxID=55513 RepID=UPI0012633295|nr:protein FAM32A-like [Pistacia vera]
MSAYENVVKGKLKLKGKALDVKGDGIFKKKKKHKINPSIGGSRMVSTDYIRGDVTQSDNDGGKEEASGMLDDYLTPAERRYLQQWEKIDRQRLSKLANKSHRDRIQDFNQYLANLTEHYDIPKVGPG